jgi:purine-nucleoside phosphorylase
MPFRKQGIATVEMEAAPLFAVAQYRQVEIGVIVIVSDLLSDLGWT